MVRVRIGAGRVVLNERQPDRLVDGTLEVVLARRVRRQRVPGTVQQSPVGVVERFDEELALAGVLGVAGRFVVDEQYLKETSGCHIRSSPLDGRFGEEGKENVPCPVKVRA